MPATVSVDYLGDPETEKTVRDRLQQFMAAYEGDWSIQLLGSQQNTIWEMTVKAPDGKSQWVNKLYGEDGGHAIEKILVELRKIVEKSRSVTSSS